MAWCGCSKPRLSNAPEPDYPGPAKMVESRTAEEKKQELLGRVAEGVVIAIVVSVIMSVLK